MPGGTYYHARACHFAHEPRKWPVFRQSALHSVGHQDARLEISAVKCSVLCDLIEAFASMGPPSHRGFMRSCDGPLPSMNQFVLAASDSWRVRRIRRAWARCFFALVMAGLWRSPKNLGSWPTNLRETHWQGEFAIV